MISMLWLGNVMAVKPDSFQSSLLRDVRLFAAVTSLSKKALI